MKYQFDAIENGQLAEGAAVVTILAGLAEVTTPEAQALAERHGGRLALVEGEGTGEEMIPIEATVIEATVELTDVKMAPAFARKLIDLSDGVDGEEASLAGQVLRKRRK